MRWSQSFQFDLPPVKIQTPSNILVSVLGYAFIKHVSEHAGAQIDMEELYIQIFHWDKHAGPIDIVWKCAARGGLQFVYLVKSHCGLRIPLCTYICSVRKQSMGLKQIRKSIS